MIRSFLSLIILFFILSEVDSQPLSGNYTIGGAGANFPTIGAAVSALSTGGVNGPVVFSIASGIYDESVEIGPVQGASAVNTIIFQSAALDSASVTISWATTTTTFNNYVIKFSGASHTTFRYVTLQRTGVNDYSQVVDIVNGSQYITLYHNRIIGTVATTGASYKSLVYGANSSSVSNITIDGNRMENGSYGVWLIGISQLVCCIDEGNVVKNNHMINQYQCGMHLQYQRGPQITGNIIEGTSAANGYGIYTFFADNNLRIVNNKISIVNGKGIYVHNTSIAGIPVNLVANNFVTVSGTGAAEGIFLDNSKSCHIYHNSVHIFNTSLSATAFKINGINSGFNEVVNNNFVNSGGGYAVYVTPSTSQPFNVSDYNNLFVIDTLFGFWQAAGSQPDIVSYRIASSREHNSVSIDPVFVSNTDLHVTSVAFDNLGSPALSSATPVYEDIDGDIRNPLTPDIGADEFTIHDLAIIEADTIYSFCEGQPGSLRLTICNVLPVSYNDTLLIGVLLSGNFHGQVHLPLMIPASDTVKVIASGFPDWPAQGNYLLEVYLDDYFDVNRNNDTLIESLYVAPEMIVDIGGDRLLCDNHQISLSPSQTFSSYLWHDSTTTQSWVANTGSLMYGNNLVWLKAFNYRYCEDADTVTINLVPAPEPKITASPSFLTIVGSDTLTVICQMFNTQFSCGSFDSCLWYNGTKDSVLFFQPYQIPLGNLTVSVTVYDTMGCSNSDTLFVYVDNCQSVEEYQEQVTAGIYPNPLPAGGMLSLIVNGFSGKTQLRIFNIIGKDVINEELNLANGVPLPLDLSHLNTGTYLLQLNVGKQLITKSVIIR